jgi:hypothetical protein
MIPIITISSVVMFFFLLLATIKVYLSYRGTREKKLGYVLKCFISFCIAMLIFLPNGILTKDLLIISFIFNIYVFFYFLGMAYFVALTFEIIHKELIKKILFAVIVISGFIFSFVPAIQMQPATMTVQEPFVFWEDARGPIINTLIGLELAIFGLWNIVFFLYHGLKSYNEHVRKRSLFFSAGMICFFISAITDYIFGANPDIFYVSAYTVFWGFLAVVLFLFALYYKQVKPFGEGENLE